MPKIFDSTCNYVVNTRKDGRFRGFIQIIYEKSLQSAVLRDGAAPSIGNGFKKNIQRY